MTNLCTTSLCLLPVAIMLLTLFLFFAGCGGDSVTVNPRFAELAAQEKEDEVARKSAANTANKTAEAEKN
jgi:hypothetical protein|tara:strand:+ start:296 stop:505 length:210 start_codon:yes stop_codon:yes gene_type:complete